jgi:hypothetical protein
VAAEDGDYFGFVDGLGKVVVHAGVKATLTISLHGVGGHGDDDDVAIWRLGAADLFGGLVAVHNGHLAIHEDEVVVIGGNHVDGFLAVRGEFDGEAEALKHAGRDELIDGVVFDEKDPRAEVPPDRGGTVSETGGDGVSAGVATGRI